MSKPAKAQPINVTEPEGPAVREGYVQDRPVSKEAGAKLGWRKPSTIDAYFDQGKLAGGNPKYSAIARLEAGKVYSRLWDTAQSSGRDSTQALNVSRGECGTTLTQAQSEAIRGLVAIESHLGQRDRIICRMVCGEGHFPSEAVRLVCSDYRDTVAARFRESMDALIEAFEAARRAPGKFNVKREANDKS